MEMGKRLNKSEKIILLFDIDYTLFDTDMYRVYLYSSLGKELGYDDFEKFLPIARQVSAKVKKKTGFYNPELILQELLTLKKRTTDFDKLEKIFWNPQIYKRSLYNNTKDVLSFIKKNKNITIGILSSGLEKHQQQKIHVIKEFFIKQHIHVFSDKLRELKEVLHKYSGYKIYIVDDLPLVLSTAKSIRNDVVTILVKRNKKYETTQALPSFTSDKVIASLSQLKVIMAEAAQNIY
jgi:FMN phosphatase YigB (HAD superfamily)